jgi:hypothetical protein
VRARWEPGNGQFEYLDTVTMVQADVDKGARPTATSLGPDGNVYVTFQRENTIQRIVNPTGTNPRAEVVGRPADGRGPAAIAAGRDAQGNLAVYVAETTGLRVLRPNAGTQPLTQPSFDLAQGGGVPTVASLAYDPSATSSGRARRTPPRRPPGAIACCASRSRTARSPSAPAASR